MDSGEEKESAFAKIIESFVTNEESDADAQSELNSEEETDIFNLDDILSDIDAESKENSGHPDPQEIVEANRTVVLSMDYSKMVYRYFSGMAAMLAKTKNDATSAGEFGVDIESSNVAKIWSASEVLNWHSTLIPAKISRAYYGVLEFDPDIEDPIQNDSNGTAKLVMVVIAESLAAIEELGKLTTDFEIELSLLHDHLLKIEKNMRLDFPSAKQFVRPGFDQK